MDLHELQLLLGPSEPLCYTAGDNFHSAIGGYHCHPYFWMCARLSSLRYQKVNLIHNACIISVTVLNILEQRGKKLTLTAC